MDRQMVYPGAIPLETDLLNTSKNAYLGLAKLAAAMLGTSTLLNGLACVPDSPASLHVSVGAGEIYSLQNIDGTAFSSLDPDTAHQIVKQGLLLDAVLLSCPAPGTGGQSINYLVQVAFSTVDTDSVVLEYYNADNPETPWSGASNSGDPNNTRRADKCVVAVKAGVAAATGSQVTPSPDAGYTGAYIVTVANGQTTILSGNIVRYSNAPFIDERLGDKISKATADALYATLSGSGSATVNVAGGVDVTLAPTQYDAGIIKLTGALTADINVVLPAALRQWTIDDATTGGHVITLKTSGGTGVPIASGQTRAILADGTNIVDADSRKALADGSTATTQSLGDNSLKIATTAFVAAAVAALINSSPGALDTLKELADALGDDANYAATVTTLLAAKAPLASPALTGNPTAPTQTLGDNTTKLATTAFVSAAVAALVNSAPGALDTLKELADALGDDANYAATITAALALKAPLASPALTGNPTAPTQSANDNSTKVATTAYVDGKFKKYTNLNNFIAFGGTSESGFAHGLGAIPDLVELQLVCNTAEGGFAIGDVVKCPIFDSYSSEDRGVQVRMTTTNLYVLFGSQGVEVINLSTGNRFAITAANWQFHIKAFKFA